MPRPNLLVIVTDQQRAPMHWPDEPGWLDALAPPTPSCAVPGCRSPARARRRRCVPQPRVVPDRHVPLTPRRDADAHRRRPAAGPGTSRRLLREVAALAVSGEAPRGAARAVVRARPAAARAHGRRRAGAAGRDSDARLASARGRLHGRLQGQVAPDHAARRGRGLGRGRRRANGARLRLRRLGAARRG